MSVREVGGSPGPPSSHIQYNHTVIPTHTPTNGNHQPWWLPFYNTNRVLLSYCGNGVNLEVVEKWTGCGA